MPNWNQITLAGHITRDPEMKFVGDKQTALATFGLAVNTGFGANKKPCFIDVKAWGKQAELIAQHFSKGSAIIVGGELQQETWEKDGQKRSKHVINLKDFGFIGGKGGGGDDTDQTQDNYPRKRGPAKQGEPQAPYGEEQAFAEEEIPF